MRAASGYYFLGIVAMEDMLEGNMMPSYIVCQSKRKSESRSGLRVVKANSTMVGMDKLLVANIHAHPELIDFMSNYRTRDHMHTKNLRQRARTRKYTPEGGLFWFYGVSEIRTLTSIQWRARRPHSPPGWAVFLLHFYAYARKAWAILSIEV